MTEFKKVKIHLKTYIRFARKYGRVITKSDFHSHPIVYAFSDYNGRILAYSSKFAGCINPGSWYIFGGVGYPFYEGVSYKGIRSHGGGINYTTADRDTPLKGAAKSVLFEIEIVPDDVPEDISGVKICED